MTHDPPRGDPFTDVRSGNRHLRDDLRDDERPVGFDPQVDVAVQLLRDLGDVSDYGGVTAQVVARGDVGQGAVVVVPGRGLLGGLGQPALGPAGGGDPGWS